MNKAISNIKHIFNSSKHLLIIDELNHCFGFNSEGCFIVTDLESDCSIIELNDHIFKINDKIINSDLECVKTLNINTFKITNKSKNFIAFKENDSDPELKIISSSSTFSIKLNDKYFDINSEQNYILKSPIRNIVNVFIGKTFSLIFTSNGAIYYEYETEKPRAVCENINFETCIYHVDRYNEIIYYLVNKRLYSESFKNYKIKQLSTDVTNFYGLIFLNKKINLVTNISSSNLKNVLGLKLKYGTNSNILIHAHGIVEIFENKIYFHLQDQEHIFDEILFSRTHKTILFKSGDDFYIYGKINKHVIAKISVIKHNKKFLTDYHLVCESDDIIEVFVRKSFTKYLINKRTSRLIFKH
jgi:hypothetical protein